MTIKPWFFYSGRQMTERDHGKVTMTARKLREAVRAGFEAMDAGDTEAAIAALDLAAHADPPSETETSEDKG